MITEMLTDLSFLEYGEPFPPSSELKRLKRYKENKLLFEDEHAVVYKEQFERIERVIGNFGKVISYATIFNYQKLMTLKIADFVFGEPPKISVGNEGKQDVINRILLDTDFYNKLYMSVIDLSRYGDSVIQVSKAGENKARLDVTSPVWWFPVVDNDNIKQFLYHCFCRILIIDSKRELYGLKVHIHNPSEPGVCEEHTYRLDGKPGSFKIGKEMTKTEELHIETEFEVCPVYHISNTATSDRCFGIDDYSSIDSIVSELIIRVSQVSKVLDKFSSPSMTGPSSAMTWNEALQRYELRIADYYTRENDTDPKPEMIVWDANLDANFKQIELLVNQLYTISEMGSAVFGDISNSTGNVASGTALRRLMISPLAKAKRIVNRYDKIIKEVLSVAANVYGTVIDPSEISIMWNDGLPSDPLEEANIMNVRTGGKATMSRTRAIQLFDGLSDKDTENELELIEADETAATMGGLPVDEPESVVIEDDND